MCGLFVYVVVWSVRAFGVRLRVCFCFCCCVVCVVSCAFVCCCGLVCSVMCVVVDLFLLFVFVAVFWCVCVSCLPLLCVLLLRALGHALCALLFGLVCCGVIAACVVVCCCCLVCEILFLVAYACVLCVDVACCGCRTRVVYCCFGVY